MIDIFNLELAKQFARDEMADVVNLTAVTTNHIFTDTAERDAYFVSNPTELTSNLFVSVGNTFYQYLNDSWVEKTAIVGTDVKAAASNASISAGQANADRIIVEGIKDDVLAVLDSEEDRKTAEQEREAAKVQTLADLESEYAQELTETKTQVAAIAQQTDNAIATMGMIKTFKGSCLFAALPASGMANGDYWYVSDQDTNYCYNGTAWVNIGNNLKLGADAALPENISKGSQPRLSVDLSSAWIDGGYIEINGTLSPNAGFSYASAPVIGGKTYRFRAYDNPSNASYNKICFFKANGTYTRGLVGVPYNIFTTIDAANKIYEVIAPIDAVSLKYNSYTNQKNLAHIQLWYDATFDVDWLNVKFDNCDTRMKAAIITAENETIEEIASGGLVTPVRISNAIVPVTGVTGLPETIVTDKYAHQDGTFRDLAGWTYRNVADLDGAEAIEVVLYTDPNVLNYATCHFRNSSNVYVKELQAAPYYTFTTINAALNIYRVNVPVGATQFNYSYAVGSSYTAYAKKVTFSRYSFPWLSINAENMDSTIIDDFVNSAVGVAVGNYELDKFLYPNSVNKPITFTGSKKLAYFGDSIAYGYQSVDDGNGGSTFNVDPNNTFIALFAAKFGMTRTNKAISGSFIVSGAVDSIYSKVTTYTDPADVIVIAGLTNDYSAQKPIGDYDSVDTTTVYGSMRAICQYLQTNYPSAVVVFITPINRPVRVTETIGSLNKYRRAMAEIAMEYKFNVVDGSQMGFPVGIGSFQTFMYPDKLHPSAEGHKLYYRNLCGALC